MKKKTKIRILQEYIDQKHHSPESCPVALAFKAIGYKYASASSSTLLLGASPEEALVYRTPEPISEWIILYDLSDGNKSKVPGPAKFKFELIKI